MSSLDGDAVPQDYSTVLTGGDDHGYRTLATCNGGNCPGVYERGDDDHVFVQGYPAPETYDHLGVPAGEMVVRIPRSVFLDAAAQLKASVY